VPDIEAWRLILRTKDVCPDQTFILVDQSDGYGDIYKRLKKIFANMDKGELQKLKSIFTYLASEIVFESLHIQHIYNVD